MRIAKRRPKNNFPISEGDSPVFAERKWGQSPACISTGPKSIATRRFLPALLAAALLAAALGAVDTLSQRRQRVEAMSAEQRDELFRAEQQFRALPAAEQQRIRDLHEQVEAAPDREKLLATMGRYCKWFETQPPFRRAKLMDKKLTVSERVKAVKEFVARHPPTKDLRLDDSSRRRLAAWLDHYTAEHGLEILAQGPRAGNPKMQFERQQIAKLPADRQRIILRETLLRRWQAAGPNGQMPISDREMARIRAGLSPELRAKLEAKKPADQPRIVADWLRETASRELDEQLADFFENSIDDEERDRLMSLPSDEMYESLSKQFRARMLKESKPWEPPHRNDGQRRGDRPPWHGHHAGSPWGSGGWRGPDHRDESGKGGGKDSPGKQDPPKQ